MLALALSGLLLLVGCGAEADAPPPDNAPEPAACLPMDELAPNLLDMLERGQLQGLASVLGDESVVTRQQFRRLLGALLDMVGSLEKAELDALLALGDDPTLRALLPLVRDLLVFIVAEPFPDAALADAARLLTVCEGDRIFAALEQVLDAPELNRVVSGLGEVLALDVVQVVLLGGEGAPLGGPRFFTAFVCNLVFSIARADFDFETQVRRPLSGIDLLDLDQPPISTLLADLSALLDPDKPLFPALADLICCDIYDTATCDDGAELLLRDPVFTQLVYDLFVSDEVPLTGLLQTAATLASDARLAEILAPLLPLLRQLASDPELRASLVDLIVTLLQPQTARAVLPEIVTFLDRGGIDELLAVVRAIFRGCEVDAP